MHDKLMGNWSVKTWQGSGTLSEWNQPGSVSCCRESVIRTTKPNTWFRKPLGPGLTLSIALRYYAAGDGYHSLAYSFRVARNTISTIVHTWMCGGMKWKFSNIHLSRCVRCVDGSAPDFVSVLYNLPYRVLIERYQVRRRAPDP